MPRNSRPRRRVTQVTKKSLHKQLYGIKYRGRADPPPFTQVPWWQITIQQEFGMSNSALFKITPTIMADVMKAQVSLEQQNTHISIRLVAFSAWCFEGSHYINISVKDLAEQGNSEDSLAVIEDTEGRNRFANVHYVWPVSQHHLAFAGNDTQSLVTIGARIGAKGIWRAKILWSPRAAVAPNRDLRLRRLEQQIDELQQQLTLFSM